MVVLGYLPNLKRALGLAFGSCFLHDFSTKQSLLNTLSINKVSMSYLFRFQDIKQNVLLTSYLEIDDVTNCFIFKNHLIKQWQIEKRGEVGNTEI